MIQFSLLTYAGCKEIIFKRILNLKEGYCTMKTTARVGPYKYEIVNFVQIARDLIFLN